MTWTTTRPTQPGYWWFRDSGMGRVVYLYQANDGLYVSEDITAAPLSVYSGEWAGPLPEPDEPTERDERESQP